MAVGIVTLPERDLDLSSFGRVDASGDLMEFVFDAAPLIGYLDTSVLVKLLLRDEDDAETARTLIAAMDVSFTSRIAYPEARAALAAARRQAACAARPIRRPSMTSTARSRSFRIVELSSGLGPHARATSPSRFALRALDAVHLASALALGGRNTVVVTWDRALASAAIAAGLGIAPGRDWVSSLKLVRSTSAGREAVPSSETEFH